LVLHVGSEKQNFVPSGSDFPVRFPPGLYERERDAPATAVLELSLGLPLEPLELFGAEK
jgi:hypothetical protein